MPDILTIIKRTWVSWKPTAHVLHIIIIERMDLILDKHSTEYTWFMIVMIYMWKWGINNYRNVLCTQCIIIECTVRVLLCIEIQYALSVRAIGWYTVFMSKVAVQTWLPIPAFHGCQWRVQHTMQESIIKHKTHEFLPCVDPKPSPVAPDPIYIIPLNTCKINVSQMSRSLWCLWTR